jgi:hypothetical protein
MFFTPTYGRTSLCKIYNAFKYTSGLVEVLHLFHTPDNISNATYRLSLESDRERLGERLLERDLLCERLRGERDLQQPGYIISNKVHNTKIAPFLTCVF